MYGGGSCDAQIGYIIELDLHWFSAEFHEYLCNQAVDITKESHDLEKTIAAGNVSTLVNNNGDLKSDISATLKRLLTSYKKMEALPTITHFAK